jgi:DNA-binding NarL/FixJ family response regulator
VISVLLADDHALVRAGIRAILEEMPDVQVVAEASDGHEALQRIEELAPAVALLDISMPGLNGLEVAARVQRAGSRARCIILSMHFDDEYIRRALSAGAAGYLLKSSDRTELVQAVRAVAEGQTWLAPPIAKRIAHAYARGETPKADEPLELLTPRQREVLQLIAEGLSTKEIAQRLELSVKTVESHRAEIMQRLDVHGVAGLVRYAIRVGIVRSGA